MTKPTLTPAQQEMDKYLVGMGWGIFLVLVGFTHLVSIQPPDAMFPISMGLAMVALNAARAIKGLPMSGFTSVVGVAALAAGIGDFFGLDLLGPVLLILLGVFLIARPRLEGKFR